MSVTRVPSLLEQSIVTAQGGLAPQVRTQLGCVSTAEVNAALIPLSGDVVAHSAQIAAISGINISQSSQIQSISAGLSTAGIPRSEVAAISSGLNTDINNVATELGFVQLSAITWSGTAAPATAASPDAWFAISISGSSYRIGVYI